MGTKRPAPLRAPSPAPATVTASTPAGGSGVEAAAAAGALAAAPAAKKPRPREATGPAPAAGPAATNIRTAPSESAIDSGSAGRPAQVMNGAIDALLTVGNEAASAGASAAAGRSLPFAAGTGAAAAGADAEACMEAPVDQFEFNFEEDDGGQLFDEPPAGGLESSSGTIAANGAMGQPFLRNTPAVLHAAAAATGTAGMAVCQADDDIALDETVGVLTAGGLVPTVVRGTMLLEDAHQAGMDGSQHAWSEQAEQEDAGQHPEGISYEQESVHEHGYDEGNVAGNGYAREFEALEDHDQGMHVGEEEDAENAEAAEQ